MSLNPGTIKPWKTWSDRCWNPWNPETLNFEPFNLEPWRPASLGSCCKPGTLPRHLATLKLWRARFMPGFQQRFLPRFRQGFQHHSFSKGPSSFIACHTRKHPLKKIQKLSSYSFQMFPARSQNSSSKVQTRLSTSQPGTLSKAKNNVKRKTKSTPALAPSKISPALQPNSERFQQGSSTVPRQFQQGSSKVPTQFQHQSNKVQGKF